jgi:hypothetical protein
VAALARLLQQVSQHRVGVQLRRSALHGLLQRFARPRHVRLGQGAAAERHRQLAIVRVRP